MAEAITHATHVSRTWLENRRQVLPSAVLSFANPQRLWGEGWSWRWRPHSFQLSLSAWHNEVRMHCTMCERRPDLFAILESQLCCSCDICQVEQRAGWQISCDSVNNENNINLRLCVS